jgi:hypothetical protein
MQITTFYACGGVQLPDTTDPELLPTPQHPSLASLRAKYSLKIRGQIDSWHFVGAIATNQTQQPTSRVACKWPNGASEEPKCPLPHTPSWLLPPSAHLGNRSNTKAVRVIRHWAREPAAWRRPEGVQLVENAKRTKPFSGEIHPIDRDMGRTLLFMGVPSLARNVWDVLSTMRLLSDLCLSWQ